MPETRRPVVYISGPITRGDRNHHAFEGYKAQAWLMKLGAVPINPIATCVAPFAWEEWATHELWMDSARELVARADAIYMLPGWLDSRGAREEYLLAVNLGKEEFGYLDPTELEEWVKQFQTDAAASNPKSTSDSTCSPSTPSGWFRNAWRSGTASTTAALRRMSPTRIITRFRRGKA